MNSVNSSNVNERYMQCEQMLAKKTKEKKSLTSSEFVGVCDVINLTEEARPKDLLISKLAKAAINPGIDNAPQPEMALRLLDKLSNTFQNHYYFQIFSIALDVAKKDDFDRFVEVVNTIPQEKRDLFSGLLAIALKKHDDSRWEQIFNSIPKKNDMSYDLIKKELEKIKLPDDEKEK